MGSIDYSKRVKIKREAKYFIRKRSFPDGNLFSSCCYV